MTCSIVGWLPIFTRPATVQIVLDSWKYLQREREFKLFGWVILENHLHLIAAAPELEDVMQRFKSFTALKIVRRLEAVGDREILQQLRWQKLSYKTESEHQVWQEGSHPQQIDRDAVMWQKLEYTHGNPVRRGYVDDPLHGRYSSARSYARMPGLIDVITDWM